MSNRYAPFFSMISPSEIEWKPSSSISNVSVALGGMEGGEPCCPYANSGAHL